MAYIQSICTGELYMMSVLNVWEAFSSWQAALSQHPGGQRTPDYSLVDFCAASACSA